MYVLLNDIQPAFTTSNKPFKRLPYKMVKYTCLSVFDHFVALALKGLSNGTKKKKKKKSEIYR